MRKTWLIAAALAGLGASPIAAEQPNQPVEPPASGSTSSELSRSGGASSRPPMSIPK